MINILVYADFDLITILRSRPNLEDSYVELDEGGDRYRKKDFASDWEKVLDLSQYDELTEINLFTNLLEASPLYESLDAIAEQTWIPRWVRWQQRSLEYNMTLKGEKNKECFTKMCDLVASDLLRFPDEPTERKVIGYMSRSRKEEKIEAALLPYLYFIEYCSESYSFWS